MMQTLDRRRPNPRRLCVDDDSRLDDEKPLVAALTAAAAAVVFVVVAAAACERMTVLGRCNVLQWPVSRSDL
jgi:hypothetical protein